MERMTTGKFRHVPVVEQDRLVGIISIGDVLKAQRDRYQGEADTLQAQLLSDDTNRSR
jgi:CBS domain-containing protein